MDRLSNSELIDVPLTPAVPSPAKLPIAGAPVVPAVAHAGLLDIVAAETVDVVGIAGAVVDARGFGPAMGNVPTVGTAGAELTPRLLISTEPNGIPARAAPPGVVGDVGADVGADDEATLLEPDPHIPDAPDVSGIPGVVDIPDVADIPDNVDGMPVDNDPDDIAVAPGVVAAEAGAVVPVAVPPPSKLAVDPNIPDTEVPVVEHVVAIAPLLGIAIVPVTPPVGAGLTPSDGISVASSGMPAGPTVELIPRPSGEVAPIVGIAVSVPASGPSTCAIAALQTKSAETTTAISEILTAILPRNPRRRGERLRSDSSLLGVACNRSCFTSDVKSLSCSDRSRDRKLVRTCALFN